MSLRKSHGASVRSSVVIASSYASTRLINGIWFHESVELLEAGSVQVFGIDLEDLTKSA